MTRKFLALGAIALLAGCDASVDSAEAAPAPQQTALEYVTDNPQAPYTPVVRAGNTLFLSGQLGTSRSEENGIENETRRAMDKIKALVEANGSGMDRVVKCTVFLADMAEWSAMNGVYATYFPEGRRPARSAVAVAGMAANARVEIECIAVA